MWETNIGGDWAEFQWNDGETILYFITHFPDWTLHGDGSRNYMDSKLDEVIVDLPSWWELAL